jgi:hypothetical protein
MLTNALYSVKEVTIPALSSMIINTKFRGLICDAAQPIPQCMPHSIAQSQGCLLGLNSTVTKTASLLEWYFYIKAQT